jgi:hypothetical protein
MIAQKMVDAKHSHEPGHAPVTRANFIAPTSWTSSSKHRYLFSVKKLSG